MAGARNGHGLNVVRVIVECRAWRVAKELLSLGECPVAVALLNARPRLAWAVAKAGLANDPRMVSALRELRSSRVQAVVEQLQRAIDLRRVTAAKDLKGIPELPSLAESLNLCSALVDA